MQFNKSRVSILLIAAGAFMIGAFVQSIVMNAYAQETSAASLQALVLVVAGIITTVGGVIVGIIDKLKRTQLYQQSTGRFREIIDTTGHIGTSMQGTDEAVRDHSPFIAALTEIGMKNPDAQKIFEKYGIQNAVDAARQDIKDWDDDIKRLYATEQEIPEDKSEDPIISAIAPVKKKFLYQGTGVSRNPKDYGNDAVK